MRRLLVRWLGAGAVACLVVVALVAGGMGSGSARAQTSGSVSIVDFSFSSATVTIDQGGSVTWTNNGAVPHSATGDGGAFDTGLINAGGSVTITFDTPGTYTYHCSVHPDMVATVVVLAADDGGDGGGEEDPVDELPNTGAGLSDGQSDAIALGLGAIAAVLMIGGFSLRKRSS